MLILNIFARQSESGHEQSEQGAAYNTDPQAWVACAGEVEAFSLLAVYMRSNVRVRLFFRGLHIVSYFGRGAWLVFV